jgi:hypothetical protein
MVCPREQIPGFTSQSKTPYGFNYSSYQNYWDMPPYYRILERQGTWFRETPYYSTFAEYSEMPVMEDGVSDTGLTLRAFIPTSSGQARETLQNYSGSTTVLDARVTCQVPHIENAAVMLGGILTNVYLTGQVWPARHTPRLDNATVQSSSAVNFIDVGNNVGVWFNCTAPNNSSGDQNTALLGLEWRTSLCQLGSSSGPGNNDDVIESYSGSLIPEFMDPTAWNETHWETKYGTAYLVLNITSGFAEDWAAIPQISTRVAPHSCEQRNEWLDLAYNYGNTNLSVTLYYSGFNTANIPITMFSSTNRTEPSPSYNYNLSTYTFDGIRK